MSEQIKRYYEFGPYLLNAGKRVLLRGGEPVPLAAKVLETLLALVEDRARVLTKDELLKRVWGDTIVEEGGLTRNVSILRKALGEQPDDHQYIVTVPGRGYQFVADVRERLENGDTSGAQAPAGPGSDSRPRKTLWVLRGLVLSGLVALALGALSLLTVDRATDATWPEIKSLAVLPLENLSGDPTQEYLADRMTEVLITSLAHVHKLRVVSRTSVTSFKGSKKPLQEIAQDLKADAVLEGSVQREGGRVKIMVRLIHGPTDTHLWARTYERELKDVLKLEGEVASAVTKEVWIRFTPEE